MRQDLKAELALRERVKELTCLYGIAQLSGQPDVGLEEILQGVADLMPPAWQYPELAQARVALDGNSYATEGFGGGSDCSLRTALTINGCKRGLVEVVYLEERPGADEGPFLKEERSLIDAIARQVAIIVERRESGTEKKRLQEQLRHADRLATIGQLAAGVAHELNEPLGNILGFAQLAAKHPDLPEEVERDLDKIVKGCLGSREVIRKLMTFARQNPPAKERSSLNQLIEDGLTFFEARCTKSGVSLIRDLESDLPEVAVDPSQIGQVLVNLVVNALQAMPQGGRLEVSTRAAGGGVELRVSDSGEGMSEEVRRKVFLPFFTTKDVDEGTGLGLSVVHGIVTAHDGSIRVGNHAGQGAVFTVRLPAASEGPEEGEG